MSQLYVGGGSQFFVGSGSAGALEFLGWLESETQISLSSSWDEVYTDPSGSRVPFDVSFMAEQAYISGNLVLYNEGILSKLTARLNGGTAGAGATTSVGTLMGLEGKAVRLLINCPYASKSQMATMVPAYNFVRAWLADNADISISTKRKTVRVMFRAIPIFATDGSYVLYNTSTTGIPAVN